MRRKPLIIIRLFAALATGAAFFAGANPALAQAPYPAKPVHIIVAFAPGGAADVLGQPAERPAAPPSLTTTISAG